MGSEPAIRVRAPRLDDGAELWRIARDSRTLDLNTPYAYVLWARDFSATSRIALVDDAPAGFIIGYRRPARQDCLFIWQVAVDERFRGLGLAGRLLQDLVDDASPVPVRAVETTITDDNGASQQLFRGFARRWDDAPLTVEPLFESAHLIPAGETGEHHDPERLYTIGPHPVH
ncbi:diaminobutyrate acetyltransferase [Microbacterium pseudoresistens]|uniref:L-2,4-diaminobutyric acid acetyltransferase n=1 Tax=Microbacterium pseudoresistens TaxID=640634 RepID=A0A7Y9EVV5_9MICO|nr:diaminobutyrate acetyltransferase [Microbacterium pseudoresistens]NYD54035.1 L-2,4-diaminobutyric acid acetyltransferase [Microbacterium pseudoresistens]